MITIYMYKDKYSGKVYIGQTATTKIQRQRLGYKLCPKFYSVISDYMINLCKTEIEVLNSCFDYVELNRTLSNPEDADFIENYYIQKYDSIKNGFNYLPGGKKTYEEIKSNQEITTMKQLSSVKKFVSENNKKSDNDDKELLKLLSDKQLAKQPINITIKFSNKNGLRELKYHSIEKFTNSLSKNKKDRFLSICCDNFRNDIYSFQIDKYSIKIQKKKFN